MTRTLWLHIGSHKTGSTSIQHALWNAQCKGELEDVHYAHSADTKSSRSLVKLVGEGENFRVRINRQGLEDIILPDRDCIVSSELLFFIHRHSRVVDLRDALRQYFDRIKVIVYLRRQDRLALSHRKQVVKGLPAARFYGVQVAALPTYQPHLQRYFDYHAKLKMWMEMFGADNMIVRRFDADSLIGGDSVTDFLSIIGKTVSKTRFSSNRSMCRRHLLMGLWLRQAGLTTERIDDLLYRLPEDGRLAPARADAATFLSHFAQSNAKLATLLDETNCPGYFDADMSGYPESGNDMLTDADFKPIVERLAKMGLVYNASQY